MNQKNKLNVIRFLALSSALALALTGCANQGGAQSSSAAQSAQGSQSKEADVVTYRDATEGAYAPYNYEGADGSPDG